MTEFRSSDLRRSIDESAGLHITIIDHPTPAMNHLVRALSSLGHQVGFLPPSQLKAGYRTAYARRLLPLPDDRPHISWQPIARELLQTTDRMLSRTLPAKELISLFDWSVYLAGCELRRIPADSVILFTSPPHHPSTLAFSHVAEASRHLVLALESSALPNRFLLRRASETSLPQFLSTPAQHGGIDPIDVAAQPFRIGLSHDQEANRTRRSTRASLSAWGPWVRSVLRSLVALLMPEFLARRFVGQTPLEGRLPRFVATVGAVLRAARAKRLLRRLGSRDSHTQSRRGFVFVALHYQPEMTTDPSCGEYANQPQFVADVRSWLDDAGFADLTLLVKEHPAQLRQPVDRRTYVFRPRKFYEALMTIPRTTLVHPDVDSSELVERARLVVTPNGSVAWEALVSGRPVLTARRTWHSACRASIAATTREQTVEAIRAVLALDESSVRDSVQQFLEEDRSMLPGAVYDFELRAENFSLFEEMAAGLVLRIASLRGTTCGVRDEI